MSETDHSSGLFGNRLLSGWNRIFGKKKEAKNDQPKPFPANHFFSCEELSFLQDNLEQCTLLQGWALSMSLWAKEKSNERDRNDPYFFPAVRWDNGLMSVWIDNEIVPEDIDKQADRLYQLQLDGYEMNEGHVRLIEARACRNLVGNLFIKEEDKDNAKQNAPRHFMWVKAVIDKPGEPLALSVYHYGRISHFHESEETVPYKQFKAYIENKAITPLSSEGQRKWNAAATVRDAAEKQFADILDLMKINNIRQGMFPANNSITVHFPEGKAYAPTAWSLLGEGISISFSPEVSIDRKGYLITSEESYLFVEVLNYIGVSVNQQDTSRELLALVRVFGKDFCGDKILSSGKRPFCHIDGIDIDRITAKPSNTIVAFNSETLATASLSSDNRDILLQSILFHADIHLSEIKEAFRNAADEPSRELFQEQLDSIRQDLSAHRLGNGHQSLKELWESLMSRHGVTRKTENIIPEATPPAPAVPKAAPNMPPPPPTKTTEKESPSPSAPSEIRPLNPSVQEPLVEDKKEPTAAVNKKEKGKPVERTAPPMPKGYIRVVPSSKGRWHTPDMVRREAYRAYGRLLSAKIKKQLDTDGNPWVSKQMMLPRDTDGTAYTGSNGIMLALWTEDQGFELPFFITEEELQAKDLGIRQDAESLFVFNKESVSRVYNIEQTTFPIIQRRSYASLKMNMISTERMKTSGYQFLDSDGFCKTTLKFDGREGLSVYDHAEKVIHIAPKSSFKSEDDYYRDLAIAMVESTREVDFDTLCLDTYLFENLVSHLGSGIISQSCRFDATNPEYSRIWRERLESSPEYTRRILEQSSTSSGQVLQSAST